MTTKETLRLLAEAGKVADQAREHLAELQRERDEFLEEIDAQIAETRNLVKRFSPPEAVSTRKRKRTANQTYISGSQLARGAGIIETLGGGAVFRAKDLQAIYGHSSDGVASELIRELNRRQIVGLHHKEKLNGSHNATNFYTVRDPAALAALKEV